MDDKQKIRSILFVTDLPENARDSFSFAAVMAGAYCATVTVYHVMEKLPGNSDLFIRAVRSLETADEATDDPKATTAAMIRHEIQDRINRLEAEPDKALRRVAHLFTDIQVDYGKPGKRILRHLRTGQYDALVIEIRRPAMTGKRISGRALCRILRKSPVPVFVVPLDI